MDEKQQLLKRRVKFDVPKLCDLAASVTKDGAPVRKIEKMEGGFCKALLMTMENGAQVIAKIPCPNAGRAIYSTASEAAVLQYGTQLFSDRRKLSRTNMLGTESAPTQRYPFRSFWHGARIHRIQ